MLKRLKENLFHTSHLFDFIFICNWIFKLYFLIIKKDMYSTIMRTLCSTHFKHLIMHKLNHLEYTKKVESHLLF